jgi:hypothetical protein
MRSLILIIFFLSIVGISVAQRPVLNIQIGYQLNAALANFDKYINPHSGLYLGFGCTANKIPLNLTLDLAFSSYGSKNDQVIYVEDGISFNCMRYIRSFIQDYTLNLSYAFSFGKISEKKRSKFSISPLLRFGFTNLFTHYNIVDTNDDLDNDDDFNLVNKGLKFNTTWNLSTGIDLRYHFLYDLLYIHFQTIYNMGGRVIIMNPRLYQENEPSPDIENIQIRLGNQPNAQLDYVGNVFQSQLNLLQFRIGIGVNIPNKDFDKRFENTNN